MFKSQEFIGGDYSHEIKKFTTDKKKSIMGGLAATRGQTSIKSKF